MLHTISEEWRERAFGTCMCVCSIPCPNLRFCTSDDLFNDGKTWGQRSGNNLPAEIHWKGVKPALPEIRKEIFKVYMDEGGVDEWEI